MRDKKFVKEELKQVKKQKKDIDAKINQDDGIVRDRKGEIMCCVPFMKCTRVGHAIPESMEDGIKMCCTNPDCAYAKHFIHPECFRSLEQNLMTIITSKGYDKSLSEKLRISEERLWTKKGLALLQKNLRCACGKGQMTRDNDAWEEREKKYGPPVEEKEKKHKTKTTTLPTITAIVKNRAPPPHDAKKLRELDSHFLSRRSPPPEENYLADKYGPPTTKSKNAYGIPTKPSTINKQQQPISKPPTKKLPVGYAPIEPKPKPLVVAEDFPALPKLVKNEAPEKENNFTNQANNEWKEPAPTLEEPNISKANKDLFPHQHYSFNANPILKNALVQTDETNFPAAIIIEPWLKMYSPKDSFDSGLASLPRSWKDSDSRSNSGRSSVSYPPAIHYSADERYQEFTKVTFIFLMDGRFGIEVIQNGRKEMIKNIFDNEWTPLYLSMAEKTIEIGETAQYHYRNFPKHVVYDILEIIGRPLNRIQIDPEWNFEVVENNGGLAFQLETPNGRREIPEETLMAAFLKKMKVQAENYLDDDINEICLSTNFAVTESQRNVFNKAALKVNLKIELFNNV